MIPDSVKAIVSPLDEKLGFELLELSPERAVARYPVKGNTQPFGLWHGGASGVVCETLASYAASMEVFPGGEARGVSLSVTHLRPAVSGHITGVATAVRIGKRLATYEVILTDDEDLEIARGTVTVSLKRK
ncbi:MAG: PaaI family thioesterase [Propionibacteriaceae bacterium]|jgi:uncharacterized protein (TIGR00369 family)|nr:PaaI family thioesterase [Propionibacteriaceae bacterium]